MIRHTLRHLLTGLAAVTAITSLSPFAATAQTAPSGTTATGTTTTEPVLTAQRLADRYSTSVGSRADTVRVIDGLRAGKDVTIGDQTITGTGGTLGYGSINIALALAGAKAGSSATSQDFLAALDDVMDMRAAGTGWGQIARELGLELGSVVSASVSGRSEARAGRAGNSTATAKGTGNGKAGASGPGARGELALANAPGHSAAGGNGQGGNGQGGNGPGGGNGSGNGGGNGGGGGGRK